MDKMYKEGGLATDGMDVDPVSGNDIPVGSNAEDVRDDVDTKLSSGEYVVPADVVKYLGVAQLEKLVDKAKVGLEDMAANGRIGGEPVAEPEEVVMTLGGDLATLDGYAAGGLVDNMDINGIIDRVKGAASKDPSIVNMLKSKGIFLDAGQPAEAAPVKMAEGGVVEAPLTNEYNPDNFKSDFNPYAHTPGFSAETGVTGSAPGVPTAPVAAAPTCPPGQLWDPVQNMCVPVQQPNHQGGGGGGGSDGSNNTPQGDPNAWMEKFDYSNPETLFENTMSTIGGGSAEEGESKGLLGGALSLAKGVFAGGIIGKFMATNNAARAAANSIILRDMGRADLADKIDAQYGAYVKDSGIGMVPETWRDGDRLASSVKESKKDVLSGWGATSTPKTGLGAPKPKADGNVALSPTQISNKYRSQGTNAGDKIASVAEKAAKTGGSIASVSQTGSKGYGSKGPASTTGGKGDKDKGSGWGGMAKGGLVDKKTTKKGLGRK